MLDNASSEKGKRVANLKRNIESWREIVLLLNSVLLWEKSWYPGVIAGVTSTLFLIIWMLEPAFLTLLSLTLMIFAGVDYFVPILTSKFFSPEKWTGIQEKKLDEICHRIVFLFSQIQHYWNMASHVRIKWRTIYYATLIFSLAFFAWVGSTVNNLLLIYICVNAILLAPGLKQTKQVQMAIKSLSVYTMHSKTS